MTTERRSGKDRRRQRERREEVRWDGNDRRSGKDRRKGRRSWDEVLRPADKPQPDPKKPEK